MTFRHSYSHVPAAHSLPLCLLPLMSVRGRGAPQGEARTGCRQGSCIELLSCHQYTASLASWMSIGLIIGIINKPDAVPSRAQLGIHSSQSTPGVAASLACHILKQELQKKAKLLCSLPGQYPLLAQGYQTDSNQTKCCFILA